MDLTVAIDVTNAGTRRGSEVVQPYVHDPHSTPHRPEQGLKAFEKVHLEPGETRRALLSLDRRSFAVWDGAAQDWLVEAGEYELRMGSSSRDIRRRSTVDISSDDVVAPAPAPAGPVATDAEFAALLGRPTPTPHPILPFTLDTTIDDLPSTWLGRRLYGVVERMVTKSLPTDVDEDMADMMTAVARGMPLRAMVAASGGRLSLTTLERIIRVLNAASLRTRRRLQND